MKNFFNFFVVAICLLALSSCSNMSNQDVGTVSGGVIGGLLGSQFGGGSGRLVAVGVGALAGAFLGGAIGKNMDAQDKAKANSTLENNSVGQPSYWTNQKTGAQYEVVPVKNVTVKGNQYCREYRTTANIAGKQQQVYGTACRKPDGTWKAVS